MKRSTARGTTGTKQHVKIELSAAEHHALLTFEYVDDAQLAQLKAARFHRTGESVLVRMERYRAEMLVGDLSYVINRAKLSPRIHLLNAAAEAIEYALR